MIKRIFIIAAIIFLNGCNSLSLKTDNDENQLSSSVNDTTKTINKSSIPVCPIKEGPIDPESHLDVWQRISEQLSLKVPDNRRVYSQKAWYLKHPSYIKRVSERAKPYLYFIVSELEKRKLPVELALLPIVESAFDPFAYSHGRASGMWQFVPNTGKGYGLKQNWWYDGRRDVYLSTHAALDYLSYLNKRFKGDWLLALAAYNSGQGSVRKAVRLNKNKGKPTDFWSLKLPRETKAYVPKLLALAEILRSQKENNTPWTVIKNQPFFTRVNTGSQIDIALAADLSEQSMKEFYQLNPAFNHWSTDPKGPHHILIPIEKKVLFETNLKTIPLKERIAYKRYIIKQGESLISIARKFSTSVALLKSNNNIRGTRIRAGKSLLIPVPSKKREKYAKSSQQRRLLKQNVKRAGFKKFITVSAGDSFWTLSRQHKVNLRSLAKWNSMAPTDTLKIGQKLVIWSKQPLKTASIKHSRQTTKKIRYKVRNGDSFARIADKFNVSLKKIKKWNRSLSRKKYLQPGQSLTLFVDITKQF